MSSERTWPGLRLLAFALAGAALPLAGCGTQGASVAASTQTLSEDFSTLTHRDAANTTGNWNTYDKVAQASVVVAGDATKTLDFGDGSDGVLSSSTGYVFNTNSRTGGVFNFVSVSITGGAITVTGDNPLIIRSLGAVTLVPDMDVSGFNGTNGTGASGSGPTGGLVRACVSRGGSGGDAQGAAALDGGFGTRSNNASDSGAFGAASNADGVPGESSGSAADAPVTSDVTLFESTGFIAGTGGGGGGGHRTVTGPLYATGGSGGGAGGRIRITAQGPISVAGTLKANGGGGGDAGIVGGACSGAGGGGGGGAIWLQSAKAITAANDPEVSGGLGGAQACAGGSSAADGSDGAKRADGVGAAAGAFPAWTATTNPNGRGFNDTSSAAAGTYVVQSLGYDLSTTNALFPSAATVSSTLNGGTVTTEFAGSADDSTYSAFTPDLTSLSSKGYRYLKFRITLVSGATSPTVSRIEVAYQGPSVTPESLDLSLSPGCSTLRGPGGRASGKGSGSGPLSGASGLGAATTSLWLGLLLLARHAALARARRLRGAPARA